MAIHNIIGRVQLWAMGSDAFGCDEGNFYSMKEGESDWHTRSFACMQLKISVGPTDQQTSW